MSILNHLFVNTATELALLVVIVTFAGIIRGCIGFGFSALVVASTSFWIDVKFTVIMVIFMEVIASIFMLNNVKKEVDYALLKAITIGGVFASFFGVWVLARMDSTWHQIIMSIYLFSVALIALLKFEFKNPVTKLRLYLTGIVAGFYNGFAGIGGIFVASMLSSSHYSVKHIRAAIVVYFFISEIAFFFAAYYNNLVTLKVVYTSLLLCLPMIVGIMIGAKLFASLPEVILKKIVLISILILSLVGLIKTVG